MHLVAETTLVGCSFLPSFLLHSFIPSFLPSDKKIEHLAGVEGRVGAVKLATAIAVQLGVSWSFISVRWTKL